MKSDKEILDNLGAALTESVYDDAIAYFKQVVSGTTKWGTGKEFTQVFQKLNSEDQKVLEAYVKQTVGTCLFAFLGFFEEQRRYKLIYEEDLHRVDLTGISEMLKAEPMMDGGWIDRFSRYGK
jgi:hypothetical protein